MKKKLCLRCERRPRREGSEYCVPCQWHRPLGEKIQKKEKKVKVIIIHD